MCKFERHNEGTTKTVYLQYTRKIDFNCEIYWKYQNFFFIREPFRIVHSIQSQINKNHFLK